MSFKNVIAVLDANVLYAAPVRDLLLSLADAKLFQPKWTKVIHDEWIRNVLIKRPDIPERSLRRSVSAMNFTFPDAMVFWYGGIVDSIDLPDPDDRHVLAAAIRAKSTHIVTFNIRDFPPKYVNGFGVQVSHPDDFVRMLILAYPLIAHNSFVALVARLKKPALSRKTVLYGLEKCGMRNSVKLLSW